MTPVTAYDDLGNSVTLNVYTTKTGANTWEMDVYNAADAASGGGFPYSAGPLATQTLTFDPTSGALSSAPTSLSVAVPGGSSLKSRRFRLNAGFFLDFGPIDGERQPARDVRERLGVVERRALRSLLERSDCADLSDSARNRSERQQHDLAGRRCVRAQFEFGRHHAGGRQLGRVRFNQRLGTRNPRPSTLRRSSPTWS